MRQKQTPSSHINSKMSRLPSNFDNDEICTEYEPGVYLSCEDAMEADSLVMIAKLIDSKIGHYQRQRVKARKRLADVKQQRNLFEFLSKLGAGVPKEWLKIWVAELVKARRSAARPGQKRQASLAVSDIDQEISDGEDVVQCESGNQEWPWETISTVEVRRDLELSVSSISDDDDQLDSCTSGSWEDEPIELDSGSSTEEDDSTANQAM
jgi:hypothetical protein